MFRELTRKKQKLSDEECIAILKDAKRGVLSVNGENGYPYGMPMNHYYDEDRGMIYFHGGKFGHKIDAMKADPRVSFCVMDEGTPVDEEWYLDFRSVIVFGDVVFVEDHEEAMEISHKLCHKFPCSEEYIAEEIRKSGPGTLCFGIRIKNMQGKIVHEH